MVLDALIKIKNEVDSTVTFRRSCREGICGSCAMNIDGVNTLACTQAIDSIKGDVRVFPLPHLPVVKDLVPDLDEFYAQYASVEPWLKTTERRRLPAKGARRPATRSSSTGPPPASSAPAVRRLVRATGGIPTASSVLRRFLRAIAGSSTRATERRPSDSAQLDDSFKLYRCHTIMNCTEACPKDLNPARAIADIKRRIVEARRAESCSDAQHGRLRWHCRRGMKELDVLLDRWLERSWPAADADAAVHSNGCSSNPTRTSRTG